MKNWDRPLPGVLFALAGVIIWFLCIYKGTPVIGVGIFSPDTDESFTAAPVLGPDGRQTDYATSSTSVYCQNMPVPGSDPETFGVLFTYWNTVDPAPEPAVEYAKDKNQVYFDCGIGSGVDVATFDIIAHNGDCTFSTDKDNVYYGCLDSPAGVTPGFMPIEHADRTSFEYLEAGYAKDKNYVYEDGRVIVGADPNTFIILKDRKNQYSTFSKDANHVFNSGKLLPTADAPTFEALLTVGKIFLEGEYAKDKNHIYDLSGEIVSGADPATFVPPEN